MRLTLRTLLAWLDDTLPPAEVRQIGQQVAETPLAQELVERIHRVTRQRRLTVPADTGHDGVDPNIVSDYIGDVLPPDLVAEYEKRCLTSDVTLAEVASVHQILSLLGQKAKVPPEARHRMYHLIRGRETMPTPAASAAPRPAPEPKPDPAPISAAFWAPPPPPKRSWVERYGPLAAAAALIAVLGWSAWMSVGGGTKPPIGPLADASGTPPPAPKPAAPKPVAPKFDADAAKPAPETKPANKAAAIPDADAKTKGPELDKEKEKAPALEAKADEVKAESIPPGAVGVVGKGDNILFRFNADARSWDRLSAGAALRDGDRVVNLPPFQTPLQIGGANVTMVGDGELKILAAGDGVSSRFELTRGRVRIAGSAAKEPIAVPFDSSLVRLTVPTGAIAGLERVDTRAPGDKQPSAPALKILSAEGAITAEAGAASESVAAGSSLLFHAPGTFAATAEDTAPAWLTDAAPSAADQERGKALARWFRAADRASLLCLVEALDDPKAEVRHDAVIALGAIGQLELVITNLSKKDDPASRKAAIAVLRDYARHDAESAKTLRSLLEQIGGSKEWADTVEKLLVGYSSTEASDPATGAKLVTLLKHEDVGIRELAIDTLMEISRPRRADRLGYDPDKPEDSTGLKNWQDLVQRHELRVPAAPKPR